MHTNHTRAVPELSFGIRFVRRLTQRFIAHQGLLNAGALTYTTLFAVVPLMTVTYSMLASIPSFQGVGDQLEAMLFEHFVPASGESLRGYLSSFAAQARTLTAVGIGFLVVTAFLMLRAVEAAFNRIWQVEVARKGLASFLLYWAVLSLGPLLLGLGFVLSSYLASLPLITDATEALGGKQRLWGLLPFASSCAAFTLLYVAVPNCRVPFTHALAGGVLVALLFEAAKRCFTFFVSHFPSYELIYGAFAAVPLFLAWIYISWVIVLAGAELVSNLGSFRAEEEAGARHPALEVLLMLEALWQAQNKGETLSFDRLHAGLARLHSDRCRGHIALLLNHQLVIKTDQGQYALCRDLGRLTLADLLKTLPWPLPESADALRPWSQSLEKTLRELANERNRRLSLTLSQLFSGSEQVSTTDPEGEHLLTLDQQTQMIKERTGS